MRSQLAKKNLKVETLPDELKDVAKRLLSKKFGDPVEGKVVPQKAKKTTLTPMFGGIVSGSAIGQGLQGTTLTYADSTTTADLNQLVNRQPYNHRNSGKRGSPIYTKDYNSFEWLIKCFMCSLVIERVNAYQNQPPNLYNSIQNAPSPPNRYISTICQDCGARNDGTVYLT